MSLTVRQKDVVAKNFVTHLNYAECMVGMMHGLQINVPVNRSASVSLDDVRRFVNLARMTSRSIAGELAGVRAESEYAQVVAPWIAVKCYYRIYHLESVLIHLASGTPAVFRDGGHRLARNTIRSYCKAGYISSHLKHAEVVVGVIPALAHKITAGANLAAKYYLTDDCVKSVRHKIAGNQGRYSNF